MATEVTVMDMGLAAAMEITKVMEMIWVSADMAPTATTMTSGMVANQTGLIPLPMTMILSSETSVITSTIMGMVTNPIKLDKVKEAATSTTSHTDLVVTMGTVVGAAIALMTTDL